MRSEQGLMGIAERVVQAVAGKGVSVKEFINAATMIPGIFVAMRCFNDMVRARNEVDARALAILAFVPVSAASMAYHLADPLAPAGGIPKMYKHLLLHADFLAQQVAALLQVVTEGRTCIVVPTALLSGAAHAFLFAAWRRGAHPASDDLKAIAAQAAMVGLGLHGRIDAVWMAAFVARVASARYPRLALPHGVFHILVIAAFERMWGRWCRR